jgi:hypothetical protein
LRSKTLISLGLKGHDIDASIEDVLEVCLLGERREEKGVGSGKRGGEGREDGSGKRGGERGWEWGDAR